MFSDIGEIKVSYSWVGVGNTQFSVSKALPNYNCEIFISVKFIKGARQLLRVIMLEYQLPCPPEPSPFISGGPVNSELYMRSQVTHNCSRLKAISASNLYQGIEGTHPD